MSRHRHKMRASGGGLSSKPEWEAGGNSNEAKEAEEKKRGGKVHKAEGEHAKHRADKRARGGKAGGGECEERARGGHVSGGNHATEIHEVKHHSMKHNPRGRARGGKVGADKAPLTTAANVKHITPGEMSEGGLSQSPNPQPESTKAIKG
jgi:hypothetical protein